jgi:uncharacterized protein YbcI
VQDDEGLISGADGVSGAGADSLVQDDHMAGVETDDSAGRMRAGISNAMVGLKKELYGKGPVKVKTYIDDNFVFCVLEDGLTQNEKTLIAAGEERLVRQYRLRFQEVVENSVTEAVERITGRKVVGYHSQIVFNPDRTFEIFVLDEAP